MIVVFIQSTAFSNSWLFFRSVRLIRFIFPFIYLFIFHYLALILLFLLFQVLLIFIVLLLIYFYYLFILFLNILFSCLFAFVHLFYFIIFYISFSSVDLMQRPSCLAIFFSSLYRIFAYQFWHVGSCAGRHQSCQISTRSVQGFRSPRWPKIAISHWLEVSPLQ